MALPRIKKYTDGDFHIAAKGVFGRED